MYESAISRIARKIILWFVVLLVVGVALWFGFIFIGRSLCHIAIGQIAELTNTRIETGSVDFRSNGSVFIERLVIAPHKSEGAGQTILNAENVHARFDVGSLLLLRPHLKRIDVNDFTFNAQYDMDTGRWNLSALKIKVPKGSSANMPLVRLERGTLQYTKVSGKQVKVAASAPLSAKFGFDQSASPGGPGAGGGQNGPGHPRQGPWGPGEGYSFDLTTATLSSGFGKSHLAGFWRPGLVTIAGGIASADVPELEMAWTIDTIAAELKYDPNDAFSLKLTIKDLHSKLSPALERFALMGPSFLERSAPFAALRRFFSRYSPRGLADIDFQASGNLKRLGESTLTGGVNCKDVGISHFKFEYPVEHLKGRIDFTRDTVTLNNLSGSHGGVNLFFNGWTRGFAPDWKYDIRVTSDNMALDDDLYNALSEGQKEFWSAFSPNGSSAIDYRFIRSSPETRTKHLTVELMGVEAVYRSFPYPLKNLTGKLSFDANNVTISNVVSRLDKRQIMLDGKVTGRGGKQPGYDILIKVNNVPLDAALAASLPDRQKDLYSQFSPTGLADGEIRLSKAEQAAGPATFTADLSFKEGSLKSEQLPLPVTDIAASVVFTDDSVRVGSFCGMYGGSPVSLSGHIRPGRKDQPATYNLSLAFENTPMNDDLFDLLPESAKKTVAEFRPQGEINLTANLSKSDANDRPDYRIDVVCLGNSVTLPQFSYPLKDITGTLTITPQAIEFHDVNAAPGDAVWITLNTSYVKLNGIVTLADNAFSGAVLNVNAGDIFFDRRLGAALPAGIRPFYDNLLPPSRFDLDFDELRISVADDGGRVYDIKGLLKLENCSLQVSGAKTELDAELNIDGLYRAGQGFEQCRAALDGRRFGILGKSFTNVTADIDYDRDTHKWTSENLKADCYGGKLAGGLELRQSADSGLEYVLQTGFENIDLKKFLSDTRMKSDQDQDRTAGKMEGSLNISARIGDSSSRIGTCKLSIADMQVGRLSPLVKLLGVLRFSEPTEFAFDRMFVDSYVKRNDLLVRKLDLSGQSVAFYGSGSMDLQTREVDLDLIARGRRLATADPSVLGSLAEGLGQAVVKIEVTGDFYDPQVVKKPLPFIQGALDVIGRPIEPK
jgi:hypothetical protein